MATDLLPSERARYEEVCRFGLDRLEAMAHTVALAFADDPIWQWVIDVDRTLTLDQAMPFARAMVAATSPVDENHGFRDGSALAMWRAPVGLETPATKAWKDERSGPYWAIFAEQIGERMRALGEFGEAMRAARPEEPHWYLTILGAVPERQGEGLGGRVLAPMIERCDRLGMATYLESSNPRNHSFYRRLGYVEQGEISGGGSPSILGFYRAPQPPG
ncbi:MAG: GNAT family N-acetyltransferase [Actinomycetota bacterium]